MGELGEEMNLKRQLKGEILQGFSYERQMSDEEISQAIDEKIFARTDEGSMTLGQRLKLQKELKCLL